MRPTRAGLGLIITVVACGVSGRILGLLELFVLAAMGATALVLAIVYTSTVRLDLGVGRSATPPRLRAGSPARIDLVLHNQSRRATPVISAHDSVQDARGAALMLAPIRPGGEARIAYRLPTHRRGMIKVGPLDLTLGDPLGLTKARLRAAEVTKLMVHPKLIELKPLVAIAGHDPTAEQQPRRALANAGDEFFALRPYVVGDELKRVNWRATARTDELVVRQEERPKTGRVTVILDTRRENYDDPGFERAVSAALSALHSGFRGGDALSFLTSTIESSDTDIRSRADLDAVDEQLALIQTTDSASIVGCLEERTKLGRGGTLVVVTGRLARHLDTAIARARRTFGLVIVIPCQVMDNPPGWVTPHDGVADLPIGWRRALSSVTTTRTAIRQP
jgi:uncharacterized protein (DUF58 family)